jgi:hypothetical protein
VELHNFTLNAISLAATFVDVCEGFLGISVNWDLWVHLFCTELHTLVTPEPRVRRAVRAGGVTIFLWETHRELFIPCTMTSNNTEWERGWFYLRNDEPGLPPYTGKVVKEKADSWWHGVSPSSCQDRLESALLVLKNLADVGLGAALVLAKLHHRRIIPLMDRWLRIFNMSEAANPVALAQSRLLPDLLPQEYATTRARRAINLKVVRHDNHDLWSFIMLPHGPLVSGIFVFSPRFSPASRRRGLTFRSSPAAGDCSTCPRPELERVHAAQRWEQERAAHKKEKRIRRRERREQKSEEFRLREQQGLSSPATSKYSSSDEEEEEKSDGGRALPERWEPAPPSPRATEAAEETAPGAGAGAPVARQPVREAVRAAEAPVRAVEAPARTAR